MGKQPFTGLPRQPFVKSLGDAEGHTRVLVVQQVRQFFAQVSEETVGSQIPGQLGHELATGPGYVFQPGKPDLSCERRTSAWVGSQIAKCQMLLKRIMTGGMMSVKHEP